MNTKAIVSALIILAFCPIAANAQAFMSNNLNINLNDVMVGARNQAMMQQLNDADGNVQFKVKKQKHHKKDHARAAALPDAPLLPTAATNAADQSAVVPAAAVEPVGNR